MNKTPLFKNVLYLAISLLDVVYDATIPMKTKQDYDSFITHVRWLLNTKSGVTSSVTRMESFNFFSLKCLRAVRHFEKNRGDVESFKATLEGGLTLQYTAHEVRICKALPQRGAPDTNFEDNDLKEDIYEESKRRKCLQ